MNGEHITEQVSLAKNQLNFLTTDMVTVPAAQALKSLHHCCLTNTRIGKKWCIKGSNIDTNFVGVVGPVNTCRANVLWQPV